MKFILAANTSELVNSLGFAASSCTFSSFWKSPKRIQQNMMPAAFSTLQMSPSNGMKMKRVFVY